MVVVHTIAEPYRTLSRTPKNLLSDGAVPIGGPSQGKPRSEVSFLGVPVRFGIIRGTAEHVGDAWLVGLSLLHCSRTSHEPVMHVDRRHDLCPCALIRSRQVGIANAGGYGQVLLHSPRILRI